MKEEEEEEDNAIGMETASKPQAWYPASTNLYFHIYSEQPLASGYNYSPTDILARSKARRSRS